MIDCVILAGGRLAPKDSLYHYAKDEPKAHITLEGRTMLEWVVNAFQSSGEIADLSIVGISTPDGLAFKRPVHCLPDHGGMVQNAIAGLEYHRRRGSEYVMLSTADIPLISPPIIRELVRQCLPLDCSAYYAFHRRQEMEALFPNSNRTFFRLKGQEVTSSNVGIVHTMLLDSDRALWEAIVHARKNPWRVARVIGFGTLLRFLCRQISIEDASAIATCTIDMPVKLMLSRAVEFGMDVDTAHQLELIRAVLRRQSISGEE